MTCIFCNKCADESVSIEHIVPESLGNDFLVLPHGIVCDKCNNYFSRKIEGPLLAHPFFKQRRHRYAIQSKKGKIPEDKGFMIDPGDSEVIFRKDKRRGEEIDIVDAGLKKKLKGRKEAAVFIPEFGFFEWDNIFMSKFLAKAAIEALTYDAMTAGEHPKNATAQKAFDALKSFCRKGPKNLYWPYYLRHFTFSQDHPEIDKVNAMRRIIFDYAFIFIQPGFLFFQFYMAGIEATIDMSNATLENIHKYLENCGGESAVGKKMSERVFAS